MRAIKQNDIIDVIYDSWYGMPLEEADKVVSDYVNKKMIPIEWIKEHYAYYGLIKQLIEEWEKENEKSI